jgi:hypothetical protein
MYLEITVKNFFSVWSTNIKSTKMSKEFMQMNFSSANSRKKTNEKFMTIHKTNGNGIIKLDIEENEHKIIWKKFFLHCSLFPVLFH